MDIQTKTDRKLQNEINELREELYFSKAINDIDDHKRRQLEYELEIAKEEITTIEKKYRFIAENISDGMLVIGADTQIEYASPAYYRQLGYTEQEMLSKNAETFYSIFHPEDRDFLLAKIYKAIEDKKRELIYKYRAKHKNGQYVWLEDRARFNYDSNGNHINTYVVCRDITERIDQVKQSDRLISAFFANISHEIRTPMNGILGFAELLKEQGLSGDQQQFYISLLNESGARMLNLINELVDISKIEAGIMTVDIAESDINSEIEHIYTHFKPEAEQKGLQFTFKINFSAKEVRIKTDRDKVIAILSNLIKNSIKYTSVGAIEFGYTLVEIRHVLYLQFFVKDTGLGIPENRQKAIFQRFIHSDISGKRANHGAGLGLSITQAYVEMLGGKIWLESVEGKGSTFYFTLPYITS